MNSSITAKYFPFLRRSMNNYLQSKTWFSFKKIPVQLVVQLARAKPLTRKLGMTLKPQDRYRSCGVARWSFSCSVSHERKLSSCDDTHAQCREQVRFMGVILTGENKSTTYSHDWCLLWTHRPPSKRHSLAGQWNPYLNFQQVLTSQYRYVYVPVPVCCVRPRTNLAVLVNNN